VREQYGWWASLNTFDLCLVVGWTVVEVTMAAGLGSLEA
jgi:hypothetical protein